MTHARMVPGTGAGSADVGVGATALNRRLLPAGLAAAVVSLAVLVITFHADARDLWSMIDLRVYLWGGRNARIDPQVYHLKFHGFLYFTYTPMALTLCMAASYLKLGIAKWLITIATVASVGLSAWLALGIAGYRRSAGRLGLALLTAAVLLWLEPVQQTLRFGQVNAVLMVIVLADLALPARSRFKGIGIGLATGFKLVPGIFILYLLVTRQFRAAAVAAGTFAVTVLYAFAVIPVPAREYWFDGLFDNPSRTGSVSYVSNQSIYGLITRMLRTVGPAVREPWLVSALIVLAVGLALAAWAERQGLRLIAISAAAVTGLLVSPVSWSHHWVWIEVVAIAILDLVIRYKSSIALVAVMVVSMLYFAYPQQVSAGKVLPEGLIWTVPYANHREWHWHGLQKVTGNLYVFAGLAMLAALAAFLAVRARRAAEAPPTASAPPSTPAPHAAASPGG